eukprot:1470674-Karenia_brevis.AAC.1
MDYESSAFNHLAMNTSYKVGLSISNWVVSSVVELLPYKQIAVGSKPIPPSDYDMGSSSKGIGQRPSKPLM